MEGEVLDNILFVFDILKLVVNFSTFKLQPYLEIWHDGNFKFAFKSQM